MLGITLLELMAVVAVIGVLGMIAIPSYRQYVMRAHRAEGKSFLLQVQANQERFYLANRRYGTEAELIAANLLSPDSRSERGLYQVTIGAPTVLTYTARIDPVAGAVFDMTADSQCTSFSITAEGARTATGTHAPTCW
jgi:type IV pilus assembly protein PilE